MGTHVICEHLLCLTDDNRLYYNSYVAVELEKDFLNEDNVLTIAHEMVRLLEQMWLLHMHTKLCMWLLAPTNTCS